MKRKRRSTRALLRKRAKLKSAWELLRKPVPRGEQAHGKRKYDRKKQKQKLHHETEWLLSVLGFIVQRS